MINKLLIAHLIISAGIVTSASAQYPVIPHDLESQGDSVMNLVKATSDKAWEKALPFVENDIKNGKPFILSASRPEDLPQAKIPAFPGAEGGGAFSFGGRGGRVFVVT